MAHGPSQALRLGIAFLHLSAEHKRPQTYGEGELGCEQQQQRARHGNEGQEQREWSAETAPGRER